MDLSVLFPDTGGSGCASAHTQPISLSEKQAKKFFDFFKVGSSRRIIFLGEVISQKMHWVKSLNYKVICTASVGQCELCKKVPTSDDVSKADAEHLVTCAERERDGRFGQRIAVLTDGLLNGTDRYQGLQEHFADGSPRGHSFDIARPSKHTFSIKALKRTAWATSSSLPPAFDLLPWIRARFGLTQTPDRPLTIFHPFTLQNLGTQPAGKPRELELAASDSASMVEVAKMKEIIAKTKEKWVQEDAAEAAAKAATASATSALAPTPEPEKKLEEKEVIKIAENPANYAPKERVVGGVGMPIAGAGSRRKIAAEDAAARLAAAEAAKGGGRLAPVGDLLGKLLAGAPATENGKHEERKGGAA